MPVIIDGTLGVNAAAITTTNWTPTNIATGGNTTLGDASSDTVTINAGNTTFTSAGARILGDFSNATAANRLAFQDKTTNNNTVVGVIPNGTATVSALQVNNTSDLTAALAFGNLQISSTEVSLQSGIRNGGTYVPMTFYTANAERLRISTAGNVSIGTATAASTALLTVDGNASYSGAIFSQQGYNYTAVSQLVSSADSIFAGGVIADPTTSQQIKKSAAGDAHFIGLQITDGITFHTGLTGVAGTTFARTVNERMRITSGGSVGIGTTSPSGTLHVAVTGGGAYFNTAGGIPRLYLGGGNGFGFNRIQGGEDIFFGEPGDTGTWRIRGAGDINLGVGNTTTTMTIKGNGGNSTTPAVLIQNDSTFTGGTNFVTPHLAVRGNTSFAAGNTVRFSLQHVDGAQVYIDNICEDTSGNFSSMAFRTRGGGGVAERMRIASNGYVGIGINGPVRHLDVEGSGRFVQAFTPTTGAITIRQGSGDTAGGYIQFVNNANTAEKGWIGVDTSGYITLAAQSTTRVQYQTDGTRYRWGGGAFNLPEISKIYTVQSPGNTWYAVYTFPLYASTCFMLMVSYEDSMGDGSNQSAIFVDSGTTSYGGGFSVTKLSGGASLEARRNGNTLEVRYSGTSTGYNTTSALLQWKFTWLQSSNG